MHKAIVLNDYLKRSRIVNYNHCTFCENTIESLLHLMWECPVTKLFWGQVQKVIEELCPNMGTLYFAPFQIVLNLVHEDVANIANFIALVAKQFIYCKCCEKFCPNIFQFKKLIFET